MRRLRTMHTGGLLILASLLFVRAACAQAPSAESSSKAPSIESVASPSLALRDALAAACAQNHRDFIGFLTAENAEVFRRLTPETRVALMKRFVLLDQPGQPQLEENPSGRPLVKCVTPGGATEMQFGVADIQENLAFIPLELRAAGSASGAGARRVTIGLVRERAGWKLLSVGLLLLDLNALDQQWQQAELEDKERAALETLERIATAVDKYRRMYAKLPDALDQLGPPRKGAPSMDTAALLDSDLAAGVGTGYIYRYLLDASPGEQVEPRFEVAATPLAYGKTGRRSFLVDAAGVIRGADHQGGLASPSDPPMERPQIGR